MNRLDLQRLTEVLAQPDPPDLRGLAQGEVMSQLRPFTVALPHSGSGRDRHYLEPLAAGHEAFWQGRPISANPLIGGPAREWTSGWRRAQAELIARSGQDPWALSRTERLRLLRTHRPADMADGA